MRGGGGIWSWYGARLSTLKAEAERKRRNAAAAERMAQSAERRHVRATADLALREKEQQQRQRASFQAAGREANQDIEMGEVRHVDLGVASTPPYAPPNPQPAPGEQT